MAYYQDIPLPRRTERADFDSDRDSPVPAGFRLELTLDSDNIRLRLNGFLNETPAFYQRRGYFTEKLSDPPGAGFRVAVVGLLDPFLSDANTIEAKHFPIVLRVIVPKLSRDGVSVNCELQISSEKPVELHVQWEESKRAVLLSVKDCIPRASLTYCPDLTGYRISGNTLYRLDIALMNALEDYPAGERLLTLEEWQELCRLQEKFPMLCRATEMLQVRRSLAEVQRQNREYGVTRSSLVSPEPEPEKASRLTKAPQVPKASTVFSLDALRPTVSRTAESIPLPPPLLESADLSYSAGNAMYSSRAALFLKDAQRLKNYTVEKARFQPFFTAHPTYADMKPAQRAWYFYWRAEFHRGIIRKTDIGYLYVAIYELLNQVTASGGEALSKLLRLWESYREDFPYLNFCMPAWCADFMLLNHLGTDFDSIHERIPFRLTTSVIPVELFLNRRLQNGISELPLSLLSSFSEYDVCASRFCGTEENLRNLEELVHKALKTAEQASLAQGVPFLESFHVRKREQFRESYYGAIVERSRCRRICMKYLPLIGSQDFQTTLAGILRACENALRRRERFPGRLKEEKLPAYLSDALAPLLEKVSRRPAVVKKEAPPAVEKRPPAKPLVIDLSRARDLEEQSWENTRKLLEALGEETSETTAFTKETDAAEMPETMESELSCTHSVKADISPENPPETQAEAAESGIFAALSKTAAAVLRALAVGDNELMRKICTENMTFPEAVYEEINEAGLDVIGDLLLDTASGEIFEDYREIIDAEMKSAEKSPI